MKFTFSYNNRIGGTAKRNSEGVQFEVKNSSQGFFSSVILFFILSISQIGYGQASVPTMTQEMVTQQVQLELDTWVQSEDFQSIVLNHPSAKGTLVLEISIYERGKVRSVFQLDSNIEDVPFRNSIKNRVKEFKFDLKKMDKKTTQKVVYTFNIE